MVHGRKLTGRAGVSAAVVRGSWAPPLGDLWPGVDPPGGMRELGYLSTTVSGAKALIHRGNTHDRWKLLGHNEMCEGYNRTWTALATKSNDAI